MRIWGHEWSGTEKTSPKINLSFPLFEKLISVKLGEIEDVRQGKMLMQEKDKGKEQTGEGVG